MTNLAEPWVWPPSPTQAAAFATIFLSLVTLWLVIVTRRMAKATQTEVQAQWRPALVPGRLESQKLSFGTFDTAAIWLENGRLGVALYNAGAGPALDLGAQLKPGDRTMNPLSEANVILAGEQRFLLFGWPEKRVNHVLTVWYRDLGNVTYHTDVGVFLEPGTPGRTDEEGDDIPGTPTRSSFGPVSLRTR